MNSKSEWKCQSCGTVNPGYKWACNCTKDNKCKCGQPGKHKTPDGMMCVVCFDHFDKDRG